MKNILISLLITTSLITYAQRDSGLGYGIQGGLQFNTATLPDIAINDDIDSVLEGDDVAKGEAQWADLTFNYKLGGFVKHDHNFGFAMLEANYTTANLKKEIQFDTSSIWGGDTFTLATLERDLSYLDFDLSYNVYLSDNAFFTLGATPSFLLSYSGNQEPNKTDFRVFSGLGYQLNDKFSLSARAYIGLSEVYEGSYIHHLMIPITLSVTL